MEFYVVKHMSAPGERHISDCYFCDYDEVGRYLISISHYSGLFEYISIEPCDFYYDDPEDFDDN